MSLDPSTERDRVYARYPPFGPRDVLAWVAALIAAFVAVRGDWSNFALGAVMLTFFAVGGVVIRSKLRKNADDFARRSEPAE